MTPHQVPGSASPNQCWTSDDEMEMPRGISTEPASDSASSSARVNQRASSISTRSTMSSRVTARPIRPEHQTRRERPGLIAEVLDLPDLDTDLLEHLTAYGILERLPGSTNPANVEKRPGGQEACRPSRIASSGLPGSP